jgi:hypothetical protein
MSEDSWEQRHREDLAEAGRLGAEFALGEVRTAARVTVRLGYLQFATGITLALAGLIAALVDAGVHSPAPARLILGAGAVCAALLGWWLMRLGARPRAEDRLFLYPGGLIQLVHDEPEPRVLRWAEVDSATICFDSVSDESLTGLDTCTLRGGAGTEITVRGAVRRFRSITGDLAAEADRVLSPRLLPSLVQAYESGEPVILGQVRVEPAGVTIGDARKPAVPTPWTDVSAITIGYDARSGTGVPARSITLDHRAGWRSRLYLELSEIPNGILLPHLIEYVARQQGIPLRHSRPATAEPDSADGAQAGRRPPLPR